MEIGGRYRPSKSVVANPDTHAIVVHPVFEESMQHIPREDAADRLKQTLKTNLFLEFGLNLYSLDKNMNVRAQRHRNDIATGCG